MGTNFDLLAVLEKTRRALEADSNRPDGKPGQCVQLGPRRNEPHVPGARTFTDI